MIQSKNPFNGQVLKTFEVLDPSEIQEKLAQSERAFRVFRQSEFSTRASVLNRAAMILESKKDHFAKLMALEMGKPVRAGREEIVKCARVCRYYAEHAEQMLQNRAVDTQAKSSFYYPEPLGPVLAVMPWNFPFWQVFRFIAPALMAGNTGLLKHASNVPQCALAIEQILKEAGLMEGVFQTLLVGSEHVQRLIESPEVRAVTLTGSEAAGRSVAQIAGQNLKKSVLELGGSDPFIVLEDAHITQAAKAATQARLLNGGQSCISAKRFIIEASVFDAFAAEMIENFKKIKCGDPLDETTDLGPLASESILKEVTEQLERSIQLGSRVLHGGRLFPQMGCMLEPTLLDQVPLHSPLASEEVFGPVAPLFKVQDYDQAVALANATALGLGASIWSQNTEIQNQAVSDLEAGMVFVNSMVFSDPRLPFGGVKNSGFGRELGDLGIFEFVNQKTVWIN